MLITNSRDQNRSKLNPADAARFLTQATFGPSDESIDQLITIGSYQAWLRQQMVEAGKLSAQNLPKTTG